MALSHPELLALLAAKIRSAGAGGLTTAQDVRDFETEVLDAIFDYDAALATMISDGLAAKVAKTGSVDETITGVKTFSSIPVLPASSPTTDNQAVRKKYVDDLIAALVPGDLAFNSNRAITREVLGLQGVNLGKSTLLDTIEELLFPVEAPLMAISQTTDEHEYGDTSNISVSYTATKKTNPITGITIGGSSVTVVDGNTQSGTKNIAKNAATNNVITSSVTDGTNSRAGNTITNYVRAKIRIGATPKDGTGAVILDADINGLPAYSATDRAIEKFGVVIPASNYLIVALPTSFGDPTFFVNGMLFNSIYKARSNSAFVNSFGYSMNFDVWVSKLFATGTISVKLI